MIAVYQALVLRQPITNRLAYRKVNMELNILLVEDDASDMKAYLRDLPEVFRTAGVEPKIHPTKSFTTASKLIEQSHIRFDLILSDTYRGNRKDRDAAVIAMVNKYREGRFCPLIVFSASSMPSTLDPGAFVLWADKSVNGDIESAIRKMLLTGIPQLARSLHDELDRAAGGFLWQFLEVNWARLWPNGNPEASVLARLVRRRAALRIAEMNESSSGLQPVGSVAGLEYYIYPELDRNSFKLGQIFCKNGAPTEFRVILTPHCHLTVQSGQQAPRAEYVLTVKVVLASHVLGAEKISNARAAQILHQHKKLRTWATPPSGQEVGKPEGRYWFLPAFLDIPHSYCDFQQIEAIAYSELKTAYRTIAVLAPPFAESLQTCFVAYHSGVGIPNIDPGSISSLLA